MRIVTRGCVTSMRISGEVVFSDQKMMVADKGEGVTYLSKSVVEFFKYKVFLHVFTSMDFSPLFVLLLLLGYGYFK